MFQKWVFLIFLTCIAGMKSPEFKLDHDIKVVGLKRDNSKDDTTSQYIKSNPDGKDLTPMTDLNAGESADSPTGFRRVTGDNRFSDPQAQSRFSSQSYKTGISKVASSKNINRYGFGSSFFEKYKSQIKSKKGTKYIMKYLQVQVNEMCGKLVENLNFSDVVRSDVYSMKEKLIEMMDNEEQLTSKFTDIEINYKHIDEDYQHIIKYYDFSKKQHEDILQFLYKTEKDLKDNEKEIRKFIEGQNWETEDKRKRVVALEVNVRENRLELQLVKDQKEKLIEPLLKQLDGIKRKDIIKEEKLDDIIREISNVDFKQSAQNELFSTEIYNMREPMQTQITNIRKENEVLLRELGRTQKDYRTMLSEFYTAVNSQDIYDTSMKSQVLNKTGEIMQSNDSFSFTHKPHFKNSNRPSSTVNAHRRKNST
jgi:hypothetical protein